MASLCFADLLKKHHRIAPDDDEHFEMVLGDPVKKDGVVTYPNAAQVAIPIEPREVLDADIPDLPDSLGYDLAVEHLGVSRCHAAFMRWTFDRTGKVVEPDPRAIAFWDRLADVELSDDAEPFTFTNAASVREDAHEKFGVELTNDYLRATCRHVAGHDTALLNLGVLLLWSLLQPA